jgi:uncharacterized coiled-coil protein SlyX
MATEKQVETQESTNEKRKMVRRSTEERIAEIDNKIAAHQASIQKLQEKKDAILNPKVRASKASKIKAVMNAAKESGMTPEEIAEKLGLTI